MDNKINNTPNKDVNVNEENLKSKVLEFIEKEKIKPTSKIYFSIRDKALWSFLLISILIGSIACSVMIFSFTNSEAGFYQMTHDSFLGFVWDVTPYLWILVFVMFGLVGYENFKHTNKGYKYSFGIILIVGLIINLIFGVIFHFLGVSRIIDQDLPPNGFFMKSSDSVRRLDWNQPDRGIISGEVVSFSDGSSTFILKDFNGNLWTISSMYVPNVSLDLISTSSEIRVIGVKQNVYFPDNSSTSTHINAPTTPYMGSMIACYVLPWNTDDYISGISKVRGYLVNATSGSERNYSDRRNNNCRAIKSYNIIKGMVELK